jgi:phosphatidate cytidylyltransferase
MRAASALVLIPLAVLAVWWDGAAFLVLVSIAAALLGLEWGMISEPRAANRIGAAVMLAVLACVFAGWLGAFSAAFTLMVFGAAAAALYAKRLGCSALDAAYGVLYIGWPCLVLVWLRGQSDGRAWTILLFAIAWASDISAYFLGTWLKGPKFWPRISPKKTWAGLGGGLAAGLLATLLVVNWNRLGLKPPIDFIVTLSPRIAVLVGLIATIATMAGDLWESALKRRFGVKDAGRLIPGHGGLLDRVDGMMFAVIAVAASHLAVSYWRLA